MEFVMVLPLLLLLLAASIEFSSYFTVSRRAEMSNNSMLQILADQGAGQAGVMHHVWFVPSLINHTAQYEWSWHGGSEWRTPFGFTQIIYQKKDPDCEDDDCEMQPVRDFIFQFALDARNCNVTPLEAGAPITSLQSAPSAVSAEELPLFVVGHEARYRPMLGSGVLNTVGDGYIRIKRYGFAMRYDGQPYEYPNNSHGMYRQC
ncbi:TadE/TadG family type IV pilus assembly protein [Parvularcula sp. IMCC14364]|uniref:TadE/TadG family type IV pilus assembly protein n=1 Tax=Parvularcula sp. IMCC14364 TaxID=3067902 RepID=UPI0027408ACD|nr:TadE/TadG family type IV pilus assembly protein [Parvularcula sp. IMCC14364]